MVSRFNRAIETGHCQRRDSRARCGFLPMAPVDLDQCLLSGFARRAMRGATGSPDIWVNVRNRSGLSSKRSCSFGYRRVWIVARLAILMVHMLEPDAAHHARHAVH